MYTKIKSRGVACNSFRRFHMVDAKGSCKDCGAKLPAPEPVVVDGEVYVTTEVVTSR